MQVMRRGATHPIRSSPLSSSSYIRKYKLSVLTHRRYALVSAITYSKSNPETQKPVTVQCTHDTQLSSIVSRPLSHPIHPIHPIHPLLTTHSHGNQTNKNSSSTSSKTCQSPPFLCSSLSSIQQSTSLSRQNIPSIRLIVNPSTTAQRAPE